MTVLSWRLFIKLNQHRCAAKLRMDDARLFEEVQRLMIPAFFVST